VLTIKPMLAIAYGADAKKNVTDLVFPLMASPKIDGFRALVVNGVVQSRSGKPIPNKMVQELYGNPMFEGCDGELAVGPTNAPDLMQRCGKLMSPDATFEPGELSFNVFDCWSLKDGYNVRFLSVHSREHGYGSADKWSARNVRCIPHVTLLNMDELEVYEAEQLALGYEGVMLNDPNGKYKNGRSGKKQPELVKVKRFTDDEAVIIGYTEMMHNDNEAKKDELGKTKRATLQENMRPAGVLGSLRLRGVTGTFKGVEFDCSGFTAEERREMWNNRQSLIGKLGTYKHFEVVGAKDKPRQPVWKGIRHRLDTDLADV
jgi:DNA ligase-1